MEQQLEGNEQGWWCCCHRDKIWMPNGQLPRGHAAQWGLVGCMAQVVGEWKGCKVWLLRKKQAEQMCSVRQCLCYEQDLFQLIGKAVQLAEFYHRHRYCGACGALMHLYELEWNYTCAQCHEQYYPPIFPCIIVAIVRGKEILLAKHRRLAQTYTLLAGFVEAGETLEQAIAREVLEESALNITNIRYIASQPWPFPYSLMIAFQADHAGGEIVYDPSELLHASWFRYDQLPNNLPSVGTIARRLIDEWVVQCRAKYESAIVDTVRVD